MNPVIESNELGLISNNIYGDFKGNLPMAALFLWTIFHKVMGGWWQKTRLI